MKKIGICGHFNTDMNAVGGQTIKTRIIKDTLVNHYGNEEVKKLDTEGWKKNKLKFLYECFRLALLSENIILLPAHNGVKILIPLFVILTKIFGGEIHYIIVGAWLPKLLEENKILLFFVKRLSYIYAQTNTLKKKLEHIKVNNVHILPNFKTQKAIELTKSRETSKPLKLCIVSRINYMKGIESAIEVINKLNKNYNKKMVTLDVYGPIEEKYKNRFFELLRKDSDNVYYKGVLDYNNIIETAKTYYVMLFPTKYYTEGFPGTILDAYLSGVPVLASRWESHKDIIIEGKTGYTFEFDNNIDFYSKLEFLIHNQEIVFEMKENCVIEASKYQVENASKILIRNID